MKECVDSVVRVLFVCGWGWGENVGWENGEINEIKGEGVWVWIERVF